jgi:GrpB protein
MVRVRCGQNGGVAVEFVPSELVLPRARAALRRERERLAALAPGSELVLTGASSLPGALTRGDIDLHLRVPPAAWTATVAALSGAYRVVKPEIWSSTLATFAAPDDDLVGIAATPVGSAHDVRFTAAWERLASDAGVLTAYNDLKRSHAAGELEEYLAAKGAFFEKLATSAELG